MATAIAHQQKIGVEDSSRSTHVPHHEVCKLSYYLYCATTAIGLDILPNHLVQYQRAHKLSRSNKNQIYELAYSVIKPDMLLNKVWFVAPELCRGDNRFLKVSQVNTVLAVQSSIAIAGQRRQVQKIMVLKRQWLQNFYYGPIERKSNRIRRILNGEERKNGKQVSKSVVGVAVAILALIIIF